jgi:hypothetical protein
MLIENMATPRGAFNWNEERLAMRVGVIYITASMIYTD